ncbi:MAG: DUF4091 domain-containing protein [Kiritimatiellae bacterium]|nr:DUF4091 domain-containing protein [Kiritimatiellia bacterium]
MTVALIYSNFRPAQRYAYDGVFASLKCNFDRWENVNVDKLAQSLHDYDILLFHENCNLANPQKFDRYHEQWRSFLENGGVIIIQEAAANDHLDWLASLGASFQLSVKIYPEFQKSNDWTNPGAELNFGPLLSSWAHFTKWPPEWIVANRDGHDMPIVLYQRVGKGLIVVTTSYFSRGFPLAGHFKTIRDLILKEGKTAPVKVVSVSWGDKFIGNNELRATVENTDDESVDVSVAAVVTRCGGDAVSADQNKIYRIPANGSAEIVLPYRITKEGERYIRFTLGDGLKKTIYFRASEEVSISRLEGALSKLAAEIGKSKEDFFALTNSFSGYGWFKDFGDQWLQELSVRETDFMKWEEDMAGMSALGKAAWETQFAAVKKALEDVDELGRNLETLRKRNEMWKNQAVKSDAGARFAVSGATSLEKVFRDKPWNKPVIQELTLQMAANEYESTQIVIIPLQGGELPGLNVVCSELISENGGNWISAENIDIRRVGYVSYPHYPSAGHDLSDANKKSDWYPDPLLRNRTFNIASDDVVQSVWITVHAPPGTAPGEYKGTLTVCPPDSPPRHLPFTVKIWDFELSQDLLPTEFTFRPGQVVRFYYGAQELKNTWERMPASLCREYLQFFLRYRITPQVLDEGVGRSRASVPYLGERWEGDKLVLDFGEFDKNVELMRKNGAKFIRAGSFSGNEIDENYWTNYLPRVSDHIKQKGWLDAFYVYLKDEPIREQFDLVKKEASLAGRLAPGLKRLCTAAIDDYFTSDPEKYIDIWVPLIPYYNAGLARQRRQKGESVWFYVCCTPERPNFFICQPSMEHRVLFWLLEKYQAEGFLYWGLAVWQPNTINDIEEDGSPKKSWNPSAACKLPAGDGFLAYPAGKKIADGLNPSIRLEVIRDGLEDWEYFRRLEERLKELKEKEGDKIQKLIKETEVVLEIEKDLIRDKQDYSKEPAKLYQKRAHVARQIEKIKQAARP